MMITPVVYIEGNIGSGKSTLVPILAEKLGVGFSLEAVGEWNKVKDSNGVTMLAKFYSSMERYAYAFQSLAFLSRVEAIDNFDDKENTIVERSIYADREVFAKNCMESGILDSAEWEIYCKWFDWCHAHIPAHVKSDNCLFVYIRASPEVCLERIRIRNRKGEEDIDLSYLQSVHDKHEQWLNSLPNAIIVNGNVPTDKVVEEIVEKLSTKSCDRSSSFQILKSVFSSTMLYILHNIGLYTKWIC